MNIEELIRRALAAQSAHVAQRAALVDEQNQILRSVPADSSLSAEQLERFNALSDQKRAKDAEILAAEQHVNNLRAEKEADEAATRAAEETHRGAPAPTPGLETVNREEPTYTRRRAQQEEVSFFRDLWSAQIFNNMDARERLSKHQRETANLLTKRASTTGTFGSLVPPQYLPEEYAAVARAARPYANLIAAKGRRKQIPAKGMTVTVPRGTVGLTAAVQGGQNTAVNNSDTTVVDITGQITTIAASSDVSRQSIERGDDVDDLVFSDIVTAYGAMLDGQLFSGTGATERIRGVLNVAGVNQISAYTAAATPTTFYSKHAGAINAVQTTRFLTPTIILLHPRRWNWLVAQVDSNGRPLAVPGAQGPFNALAGWDSPQDPNTIIPVGSIQGVPVFTDPSVPTTVGTASEDVSIVQRIEDAILWEDGDGLPKQFSFEQPLAGSLTVKLLAYGYAAATFERYPTATALVGGNSAAGFGQIAPTF